MRMLAAAALAALLAPLPAAAQDWHRVGGRENGTQYIDLASIKPDGELLRANGVAVFAPVEGYEGPARVVTIAQFDCKASGIHFLRFEAYARDGALLEALDNPHEGFVTASPGTPFGDSLDFVCNLDRSRAARVADPLKEPQE
ncbi:MAG: surface-adhesin E family protein [Sphingomonas sp.]